MTALRRAALRFSRSGRGPASDAAAAPDPRTASNAVRGRGGGSLRIRLLDALAWLVPRLPWTPLVLAAELAGEVRYRRQPAVAARVRGNLGRVCGWLVANDQATPRVRRAANDPAALERLVRSAFRHHARTYLEMLLAPSLTPADLDRRLHLARPDLVESTIGPARRAILVGLHLGSIELPAILVHQRTGTATTTPMETIADAPLQAWLERTRGATGLTIVGLGQARRALRAALDRGEIVGIIADRDITGGGMPVGLFGAPAPLPIGPALLAVETDTPVFVGAVHRVGRTRYHGELVALDPPPPGARRDRVLALLHAEARAFERIVAPVPDQWWSVFFPIWPDLEPPHEDERRRE